MKKYICLLFVMLGLGIARAQDVIVLRNTDEIYAKVVEINPESVKYVQWDFQDGPVRIVDKRDIFFIKYQNGQKETFTSNDVIEDRSVEKKTFGKYIHRIKPQGYLYGGMVFNGWYIGPSLDFTYGARFYDYFFLGVELGYSCWFEKLYYDWGGYYWNWTSLQFASLRLNMKGYWPITEKISPFMNFGIGTSVWIPGAFAFFNMQLGAGVEIRRFSVDMGYNLLSIYGAGIHSGYLRFGVRF